MKIRDSNQLKKVLFSEKPEEELERIMYTSPAGSDGWMDVAAAGSCAGICCA